MKAICIQLVKTLLEKSSNANVLAEKLNVSSRSIKNYVKEINSEYENAIISSRDGYKIDKGIGIKIIESYSNEIPQTSNERVYYIITKLLNHNYTLPVNVYDLCDELFISSSTIKNDLIKVKRKLKKFDLELNAKGDYISVKGLEKNKRHLLSSILYEESSINFLSFDALKKSFVDIDIDFIKDVILETLNKYHYFVNDYSLINLILHIAITIDRIKNKNLNTSSEHAFPLVKFHEYEIAKEIADILEKKFDVSFNTDEKIELALLIVSRATAVDYNNVNSNTIATYVGDDCYDLVTRLVSSLEAFYHISLREDEFLVRFALHIKNLLVRAKNNYFSKNPLAEGIKKSCPLIYDASVNIANEIKSMTGVIINDDEIAYIAFHIGSALETQEELKEKIKAIYYCPSYYDHNNRLVESLKKHLGEEMIITNIVTDESQLADLKDIDLIITSIPISRILTTKVVTISMFPNDNDISKLLKIINETRKEKERNSFKTRLIELLDPRLFEVNTTIKDFNGCITYMTNKLARYNYVDSSFYNEVIERENTSSTAFSNFAIPHSLKMNANKTGISVLINPEGIAWNNQNVSIVIMMCFNKNERFIFNELYEPMTMILTEIENVNRLINTVTYDEFINMMAMMI